MKHVTLREFEDVAYSDLPAPAVRRLKVLDARVEESVGTSALDWTRKRLRAKNLVGVLQVPGMTVEVLPKIDRGQTPPGRARRNLLTMLTYAGVLRQSHETASLEAEKWSLFEIMIALFAAQLESELQRGISRAYESREENLPVLRGRLVIAEHLRHNAAGRARLFVRYDDFIEDTLLNRVLHSAAKVLVRVTQRHRTKNTLRRCLELLSGVNDAWVSDADLDRVRLDRNTSRFREVLTFAKMVLRGQVASPSPGRSWSFSLVFPMETVFEAFVAGFVRKHAADLGLNRSQVRVQAKGRTRTLLRDRATAEARLHLRPDILIDDESGRPKLIVDTKWKVLRSSVAAADGGPSTSDVYQMLAYSTRYDVLDVVLLYPAVDVNSGRTYSIEVPGESRRMRVAFLDVSRDLLGERAAVIDELRQALAKPHDATVRRWTGQFSDFFPKDIPCVPTLVSLLIRYDDARVCFNRFQSLGDKATDDAHIERAMAVRYTSIAVHDAAASLRRLVGDAQFREELRRQEDLWGAWKRDIEVLGRANERLSLYRNKIAAHLDPEYIAKAVEESGDHMEGAVQIGERFGGLAFPVAHLAMMFALNDHPEEILVRGRGDGSTGAGFAENVAAVTDATTAVFRLTDVALRAFSGLHRWYEHAREESPR